jgi:hypothetical protein
MARKQHTTTRKQNCKVTAHLRPSTTRSDEIQSHD